LPPGASLTSMTDAEPVAYPYSGVTCVNAPVRVLARYVAWLVVQAVTWPVTRSASRISTRPRGP
jgi:hypothetical protein